MPSAFAFAFGGDDDELSPAPDASNAENVLDPGPLVEPKIYDLKTLLSGLPSSLNYTSKLCVFSTDQDVAIPQRDFSDMKAQLMAEDDGVTPIPGIQSQDLQPKIYEGGFKTWECAEDLSNYLLKNVCKMASDGRKTIVVELGAGTALPSCTLLQSHFTKPTAEKEHSAFKLIVADYNKSVLEVATIPNIFLTWAKYSEMTTTEDFAEVTEEMRDSCLRSMISNRVDVNAISGAWSTDFVDHVVSLANITGRESVLILASETIYSPASLHQFTLTLVQTLQAVQQKGAEPIALVASKKIYFGVGGGLDDFAARLSDLGGRSQVVWQSNDQGVGRAIVAVSIPEV